MKRKPAFSWDPETGSALCILYDRNNLYYGTAQCADQDKDMMSEKTGCEIAYHRAMISALRSHRDELQAQYQGLHNYYYSMNNSKYFDPESYPIRRLKDHLEMIKNDISVIKDEIKKEQNFLNLYITDKDNFYKKIRSNRKVNLDK